jgi:hypothetical protein
MNLLTISLVVYLVWSNSTLFKMDTASKNRAKQALEYLQTMVNGLRSTSTSKEAPDINMKFYLELLKDAPLYIPDWFEACFAGKRGIRKKAIEQLFGLHFEGKNYRSYIKVAVYLQENGFGPKICAQQDLVTRTLDHAAFKDLSFWPSKVSPAKAAATPEPVEGTPISPVAAPEPMEETPVTPDAALEPMDSNAPVPQQESSAVLVLAIESPLTLTLTLTLTPTLTLTLIPPGIESLSLT